MKYTTRVQWTKEEEEILLEAIDKRNTTGINSKLEEISMKNDKLWDKYKTNKKVISNKIASLQNKPQKYSPRSKWTETEEHIILNELHNVEKIVYKDLASKHPLLQSKYNENPQLLKNKANSLKKKYFK